MTVCRWDRDTDTYLTPDGEPCRRDDYGDPTRHCQARRTCALHVGPREQTCARCLGRTRTDIRQIVNRSTLDLPNEAIETGVNSEAMNLAGPATDTEAWSWHKIAAKQGRIWHASLIEDDDDWHPFTILTRWAWLISNTYSETTTPDVWTITNAAAYLERVLHRVAQDDGQDFPQLARELRKCRAHLEAVLSDSLTPERGAPCPDCKAADRFVRLHREYPHWCADPDCERIHTETDDADKWVCPRDNTHWWTAEGYAEYERERMGA